MNFIMELIGKTIVCMFGLVIGRDFRFSIPSEAWHPSPGWDWKVWDSER